MLSLANRHSSMTTTEPIKLSLCGGLGRKSVCHYLFEHLVFNTKPKLSRILIRIQNWIQISGLIRIQDNIKMCWMCWFQSSYQVRLKLADHCTRNASNCHKITYLAMQRKSEKSRIGTMQKFNHFQRVTLCPCLPGLVDTHPHIHTFSYAQTHRQTHCDRNI